METSRPDESLVPHQHPRRLFRPAENATIGSLPPGKEVVGPLFAELPGANGYVGITEADPWNYSGLSFKFNSADSIGAQFKYDTEWTVNGGSPTAWRVAMVGADLNSVMQGRQLVTHLSPAPDPKLTRKARKLVDQTRPLRLELARSPCPRPRRRHRGAPEALHRHGRATRLRIQHRR